MPIYSIRAAADWPDHFPKDDPLFDPEKLQSAGPPWLTLNTIDALNYWRRSCQLQLDLHGDDPQARCILEATFDIVKLLKRSRIRNSETPFKCVDVFPYEVLGMVKMRSLKRNASDDKYPAQRAMKRKNTGVTVRAGACPVAVDGNLNGGANGGAASLERPENASSLAPSDLEAAVLTAQRQPATAAHEDTPSNNDGGMICEMDGQ